MPAQVLKLRIMDEDQLFEEVLDKFINCHEQTYEEFLSTFTHLSKEDNGTKNGALGTGSSKTIATSVKFTHKNEQNDHHLRKTAIFPHTASQRSEEEEQIVIDEGLKVSSSFQGDLKLAGKVKVDNFLSLEDVDIDEETDPQMRKDRMLLPGEVEQELSTYVPSYTPVDRPPINEEKLKPTVKRTMEQVSEILGDEVQPFSLDEEFDYDNVTLTPKYTPEDIDTIKELLKQGRKNTSTNTQQ
ncbi:intraflagellar transport-associated protein isoform X1 [Dipodomys spectabilis]|uniref:intraflagellar transport-associated protein isoform X1 n=1 Tax=Dipodomys spectabilis TaxID=105255 RepID=UPI001C53CF93|nr:intraflagellar transport-associated protein isoform X1 [Dipodomys spectabilis]XP_042547439.1 intraflagellar transport-associated protein isoform X1 [Dipodomys spectabilis]XP_042547440.1 intraflagellar transport-associated protein isoform X1 [Dipodomys spectabilis]